MLNKVKMFMYFTCFFNILEVLKHSSDQLFIDLTTCPPVHTCAHRAVPGLFVWPRRKLLIFFGEYVEHNSTEAHMHTATAEHSITFARAPTNPPPPSPRFGRYIIFCVSESALHNQINLNYTPDHGDGDRAVWPTVRVNARREPPREIVCTFVWVVGKCGNILLRRTGVLCVNV